MAAAKTVKFVNDSARKVCVMKSVGIKQSHVLASGIDLLPGRTAEGGEFAVVTLREGEEVCFRIDRHDGKQYKRNGDVELVSYSDISGDQQVITIGD